MKKLITAIMLTATLASTGVAEEITFDGICPACRHQGLKSKVYVGASTCTLLGWMPYYDEDGVYHSDDPNTLCTMYECSQGHQFTISTTSGKSTVHCDLDQEPQQIQQSGIEEPVGADWKSGTTPTKSGVAREN